VVNDTDSRIGAYISTTHDCGMQRIDLLAICMVNRKVGSRERNIVSLSAAAVDCSTASSSPYHGRLYINSGVHDRQQ